MHRRCSSGKKNIDILVSHHQAISKLCVVSQEINCYRKHCIILHKGCILYITFIMVQSSANTMRQCSRRSNPPTPQTTQGQQHKSIPPPPLKKKFSELAFTIVTVKLEMLELVLVSSPELWPIHYHCLCDKEMRIFCSQSMPLKKDHGQYLLVNLF